MPSIDPKALEALKPYLDLGEKLGSFIQQLSKDTVEKLNITYYEDRKSNCLDPSIRRRKSPVNRLLEVVQDGMERSLEQAKPGEAFGKEFSGPTKADSEKKARNMQQGSAQPPKRRSQGQALIEFGKTRDGGKPGTYHEYRSARRCWVVLARQGDSS